MNDSPFVKRYFIAAVNWRLHSQQTGGQTFLASFKHEFVAPCVVCLWTFNVTIFFRLLSQEAPVTDADTNKSPSHPVAKTSTQVPKPKVRAQLCLLLVFVYALILISVPVLETFMQACML